MTVMTSVCVFCGSSPGLDPIYLREAERLGAMIAERGLRLVYGGAQVGLMGRVADAAIAAGGQVVGVIPQILMTRELAHPGLTDLHVVGSMHERKALMEQLSGGFIALPGGMGTFEELCEIFTWGQLGLHAKPCGLLDVAGYYGPFLDLLDGAVQAGFLKQAHRDMVLVDREPAGLLDQFTGYVPPAVPKWMTPATS
jgi:uncharacterized protein (TIGR00730 family)